PPSPHFAPAAAQLRSRSPCSCSGRFGSSPGRFALLSRACGPRHAPCVTKAGNPPWVRADSTYMDDMHAQSLQAQAIEALSNLRAWIWAQHATLLPDDVSTVTREQAERYSAYLEWYTTVETALQALEVAAPPFAEQCLPAAPRDTQPAYAPEP